MTYTVKVYIKEFYSDNMITVYEGNDKDIVRDIVRGYSAAGKYVRVDEN